VAAALWYINRLEDTMGNENITLLRGAKPAKKDLPAGKDVKAGKKATRAAK